MNSFRKNAVLIGLYNSRIQERLLKLGILMSLAKPKLTISIPPLHFICLLLNKSSGDKYTGQWVAIGKDKER